MKPSMLNAEPFLLFTSFFYFHSQSKPLDLIFEGVYNDRE